MLFADLLSLHLVTFLMFFILVILVNDGNISRHFHFIPSDMITFPYKIDLMFNLHFLVLKIIVPSLPLGLFLFWLFLDAFVGPDIQPRINIKGLLECWHNIVLPQLVIRLCLVQVLPFNPMSSSSGCIGH